MTAGQPEDRAETARREAEIRASGPPKTMPKGPSGISPSGRGVQRMRGIPPATLAPPLAPGVPPKDFDG